MRHCAHSTSIAAAVRVVVLSGCDELPRVRSRSRSRSSSRARASQHRPEAAQQRLEHRRRGPRAMPHGTLCRVTIVDALHEQGLDFVGVDEAREPAVGYPDFDEEDRAVEEDEEIDVGAVQEDLRVRGEICQ